METAHANSEVVIPDQVIDDRFHTAPSDPTTACRGVLGPTTVLTRRQRFAATLLLVVLTVAALGVATVVAVGALIVAAVLFVVGLIARLALAISGKAH